MSMNIRNEELISRAKETLMSNVYDREGYPWSPYVCISPSKTRFKGIWNWDSAFHAVGISRWDTGLAKESILGFLQYQREDGLLPDAIMEDGTIAGGYSKPPVFAWASQIIYEKDGDIEFIKKVYPMLKKNISYMEGHRQRNGLFYYDSEGEGTEDYLLHVRWESGWDNSVRWDKGILDYYAIDLNCFVVMFYRSLSFMAKLLGFESDACEWDEKEKALSDKINEKMWDDENKYYADSHKRTGEVSDILTPASFMPLYIGIASDYQAECMKTVAETRFKSKMPTVSFDNPEYSNDYWRGPTWLNVAYFAAKGLKNYGFQVADTIKEGILDMCYNEKGGIFENYDSVTGKGLCNDCFSWSCVFILEFIYNW